MQEPSLISRKLKPPLESRRVRTQPCSRTSLPTDSALRACDTVIFSMNAPFLATCRDDSQRIPAAGRRELPAAETDTDAGVRGSAEDCGTRSPKGLAATRSG